MYSPQAYVQPSLMLPSQVSSTMGSPYLDYSAAYAQYASAAFEQYPYAASPGFLSYAYPTTTHMGPSAAATPTPVPPSLSAGTTSAATAFLQYPAQPLHLDRLQ